MNKDTVFKKQPKTPFETTTLETQASNTRKTSMSDSWNIDAMTTYLFINLNKIKSYSVTFTIIVNWQDLNLTKAKIEVNSLNPNFSDVSLKQIVDAGVEHNGEEYLILSPILDNFVSPNQKTTIALNYPVLPICLPCLIDIDDSTMRIAILFKVSFCDLSSNSNYWDFLNLSNFVIPLAFITGYSGTLLKLKGQFQKRLKMYLDNRIKTSTSIEPESFDRYAMIDKLLQDLSNVKPCGLEPQDH